MPDSAQLLNYHTGLFLEVPEFTLEQDYHRTLRRAVNYGLLSSGIVYGLNVEYNGTAARVTKGIAVNNDPVAMIAKEIILANNYDVPLTGISGQAYIVLSYDTRAGYYKITSPPNNPATTVEVAKIDVIPGTAFIPDRDTKIVLASITIGTPLTTNPARQMAKVRSDVLPAAGPGVTPGILLFPTSVAAGTTAVVTVIATGGFDLTGATAANVNISGAGITNIAIVPNSNVGTMMQVSFDIASGAALVARTLTVTRAATVSASFYITPGLTLTNYVGVNVPGGVNYIRLIGTGFSAPALVEFSAAGGGFTPPLTIFGNITPTEIRVDKASIPVVSTSTTVIPAVPGPVRVTVPIFGTITSAFTFVPPAVITNINPNAQGRGGYITITGGGFFNTPNNPTILFTPYNQANAVRGPNSTQPFPTVSTYPPPGESWSETSLVVRIPPGVTPLGSSKVWVVTGAVLPAAGTPIPPEGEIVQGDTPITIS